MTNKINSHQTFTLFTAMALSALTFLNIDAANAKSKSYSTNPDGGNSTLLAVFEAPFGERISALSSTIDCSITVDEDTGFASGKCKVPLIGFLVDSDGTKTDHFYQWSTNKKVMPEQCNYEVTFSGKADGPLKAKEKVAFAIDGTFTVCGRGHVNGKKEKLIGNAMLLPAGTYGKSDTIRIRIDIDKFNRENYQIGPKWTSGWLSRIQQLAPVVSAEGNIHLNLFATTK